MEGSMSSKVYSDISISADGYVAGLGQTVDKPFGDGPVDRLHAWMFDTPDENQAEVDRIVSAGAFVMGRNMFGPIRGDWDPSWRGWWGEDPPYHAPVYVLTHHERAPLPMAGGTTFHFVTDGIESALKQARAAAGEQAVSIAGGATTVRQYLAAGLVDELLVHVVPVVLGEGERLWDGLGGLAAEPTEVIASPTVTHVRYRINPTG
jgi:dihydrofolate reductase